MNRPSTRARVAAAIGAGALAATTLGMAAGPAAAESQSTEWGVENTKLTMTVSDTTPKVGDTITLRADFQRRWSMSHVSKIKQLIPSCLDYVDGSTEWEGSPVSSVEDHRSSGAGDQAYVLAESAAWNSWKVNGIGAGFGSKYGMSSKFVVTSACATGQPLSTSVHFTATLASGSPQNAGPTITVAKTSGSGNTGGGNNGGGSSDGGGDNGGGGNDGGGNDGGDGGNTGGAGSSSGSLDFGNFF